MCTQKVYIVYARLEVNISLSAENQLYWPVDEVAGAGVCEVVPAPVGAPVWPACFLAISALMTFSNSGTVWPICTCLPSRKKDGVPVMFRRLPSAMSALIRLLTRLEA